MEAITITQITPHELEVLIENSIKKFIPFNNPKTVTETHQWFSLPELCNYLPDKPAKATLYGYVSANTIPHHKGAKKLRFLKSEIDEWLKQGRKKTQVEIQAETDAFVNSRKKKGGNHV